MMVKGKGVSISPEHDQDAIVRAIRVWCTIEDDSLLVDVIYSRSNLDSICNSRAENLLWVLSNGYILPEDGTQK